MGDRSNVRRVISTIEQTRLEFRPPDVRILFVGESAPASGDFFYSGNKDLTRYTQEAFERAFNKSFPTVTHFLEFFKSTGCWLDDISHDPVNRLRRRDRKAVLDQSLPAFAQRLRETSPNCVVVIVKQITRYVDKAIAASGVDAVVHRLPFPGFGHQTVYINELASVLRAAKGDGILVTGDQ
jgi:hypothetical protein